MMNRKTRTEILLKSPVELAAQLAGEIQAKYDVKTIEEPNPGLVMLKVRETAYRSLFYLGEVLITECKVLINGHLGIGMIKGDKPEFAYYLAVIDAAYQAELPETKRWTKIFRQEDAIIKQLDADFKNKVSKTKVNFQTMDV